MQKMWHVDIKHNKESFSKNYKFFLMEALGLALFMFSACFFAGELWHPGTWLNKISGNDINRFLIMGIAMALTALFIFYSPVTAPSGSHINPAVTLAQLYMGNISRFNTFYYIVFQFAGGTLAVYIMAFLMKGVLTLPPVNYVVTVPAMGVPKWKAAAYEFTIAFIMMTMVLNVGNSDYKKYTRIFAAILVFLYVIIAAPVTGFGMNPARSFASALPSGIYTAFGIYFFIPVIGMLAAAIFYKNLPLLRAKTL